MSQLILPHTIDAGTAVVASEHQQNYVAIRDLINGNLEGGGGVDSNFKANGITARELADAILLRGLPSRGVAQEGVHNAGDLKVTPGAGLVLNYASGLAWTTDASGLLSSGALIPALLTGSSVTVGANASGNPRIDQIILTMSGYGTGTVSVLPGTAAGGATLDNRTGAAALPSDAIRLADILMPNGFAGPFVQATHIRDRRPWARGFHVVGGADLTSDSTTASTTLVASPAGLGFSRRLESSGVPVRITYTGRLLGGAPYPSFLALHPFIDGAIAEAGVGTDSYAIRFVDVGHALHTISWEVTPTAGSHLFDIYWKTYTGTGAFHGAPAGIRHRLIYEEVPIQNASNDGA